MQQVIGILAGVEFDSDRQALHHLHVVAGGVLGRQEAKAIAARARQVPHVALVIAAKVSTWTLTRSPRCIRASCVSLKSAVTQMSSVSVTNISVCPGSIR